jgi:hypothetical protein
LEKLGFGFCGKKWGIKGILVAGGGYGWWRRAGGGVSVVGEVMGGGGLGFGGVWEERSGDGTEKHCTAAREKWGRGGENVT